MRTEEKKVATVEEVVAKILALTPVSFCVAILWLHGRSANEIARAAGWTSGQVRGFTHHTLQHRTRSEMTQADRQAMLDLLKLNRTDGGKLNEGHFRALPLQINQIKAKKEEPAALDMNTKAGRKEHRRRQKEQDRIEAEQRRVQKLRELGHATRRGKEDAALEWLDKEGLLSDPDEKARSSKSSSGQRRFEAGLRLRAYMDGERLSGLAAIDYERATMGAGGGAKMTLAAHKIQCMHALRNIRQLMSQMDFAFIEAVIDKDIFVWAKAADGSRAKMRIYDAIRTYLDIVAVHERLMTREGFAERWDQEIPWVDQDDYIPPDKAAEQAGDVRDLLESVRGR